MVSLTTKFLVYCSRGDAGRWLQCWTRSGGDLRRDLDLPNGWQQDTRRAADEAEVRPFGRTPVISREADDVQHVVRGRVHADQVASDLPWLCKFYRGAFRELGGPGHRP